MSRVHDYTKIVWGSEFSIDAPLEGLKGEISGQGEIAEGDYVVVSVRCRVTEVESYTDTPDVWRASVAFLSPESTEGIPEESKFSVLRQLTQFGDTIQQSQLYQQFERLFASDSLTQVANRGRFDSRLAQEWRRMTRDRNPLSLIACQINELDTYREQSGGRAGDECLKQVAQALSESAKRSSDLVARYQGDRFLILLPNTPLSGAAQVAQTALAKVTTLKPFPNNPALSLSLGVVTAIPQPTVDPGTIILSAEAALRESQTTAGHPMILRDLPSTSDSQATQP